MTERGHGDDPPAARMTGRDGETETRRPCRIACLPLTDEMTRDETETRRQTTRGTKTTSETE